MHIISLQREQRLMKKSFTPLYFKLCETPFNAPDLTVKYIIIPVTLFLLAQVRSLVRELYL